MGNLSHTSLCPGAILCILHMYTFWLLTDYNGQHLLEGRKRIRLYLSDRACNSGSFYWGSTVAWRLDRPAHKEKASGLISSAAMPPVKAALAITLNLLNHCKSLWSPDKTVSLMAKMENRKYGLYSSAILSQMWGSFLLREVRSKDEFECWWQMISPC